MIEISKLEKELHKKGYVIDKTPEIKSLNYLQNKVCLLYTSPSPRDRTRSRMPSSA